jgi:transposase
MTAAILLRDDFDGSALRRLARQSRDAGQTRRLLALAAIYDGGSRSDAARTGGVGVQIVRDWVVRFNAKGFDGLLNGKAPGARSILDDSQRQALRRIVEDGPIPAVHSVVRWRLIDLAQWVFEEFRVSISKQRSVVSCAPWASASSRQGRAITRKTWKPLRILKKLL